jgi:hypothetical protein
MELLAIVITLLGPVLLVAGSIGWWRYSAYLMPEEGTADTLRRYERELDDATYATLVKLIQIRKEHAEDDAGRSGT